ncbi:MAG: hypothetical protein SFU98_05805 [Leptospiraceae bacterium]|nr:hypothetical protein [Leptospiraceae bacterium]
MIERIESNLKQKLLWEISFLDILCILILTLGYSILGWTRIFESLWHDEAWVAISVMKPTWSEMFYYNDPVQTTPWGMLTLIKMITMIFGENDIAFRLVSILSGYLFIFLFFQFGKKVLDSTLLSFFVVSITLLTLTFTRYFFEVKQYSIEPLVAIIFLDSVYDLSIGKKENFFYRGIKLILLPWFSHSIFILFPLIALIVFFNKEISFKKKIFGAIVFILPIFISELIYIKLAVLPIKSSNMLQEFWKLGFPIKFSLISIINFLSTHYDYFIFHFFSGIKLGLFLSFIVILGILRLNFFLITTIFILTTCFILSCFNLYPFSLGTRLYSFCFPIIILSIFSVLNFHSSRYKKFLIYISLISLIYFGNKQLKREAVYDEEPMKEIHAEWMKNFRDRDVNYIYFRSKYTFNYYNRFNKNQFRTVGGEEQQYNPKMIIEYTKKFKAENPNKRVHLLVTRGAFTPVLWKFDDELIIEELKKDCTMLKEKLYRTEKIRVAGYWIFECID